MFRSFPLLVEYHGDKWPLVLVAQLVEHCQLLEFVCVRKSLGSLFSLPWQSLFGIVAKAGVRCLGALIVDSVSMSLSSLSKLRVLEIPRETVKAENILKTPWVCLNLEEFWCQIVEVPFLGEE
ncbi:hypothetical protein BGZ47_010516 [Haplosporangium gracile]|nr:hypothetical protein BGZ47_010516 [Haplosporangium gracile]